MLRQKRILGPAGRLSTVDWCSTEIPSILTIWVAIPFIWKTIRVSSYTRGLNRRKMEPFNVHVLGCGSALPTLKHSASSQVVEIRGKFFMIDCGEGTQIQLRRSRIGFTKISAVFISHLHGDHCFGLIGLISTFGMLGRTAPLHVYAPAPMGPLLKLQMEMFQIRRRF